MITETKLSIKQWAEDDRPREKMMTKGRQALSAAELIAILIQSGTKTESAVDVAKRILTSVDNDLDRLAKLSLADLTKFRGIGKARAIAIAAALELGRRRRDHQPEKALTITSSKSAFDILYPYLADLDHEEFYLLCLNRRNQPIDVVRISQGGVAGTVVDNKLIFKTALEKLASGIIVAHNHPSGQLKPSDQDIKITRSMKEAGGLLDISLLDHVIVGGNSYFSFADSGML